MDSIRLQPPSLFLTNETRCGFDVTVKRKKVWAVEIDLFNELSAICSKHKIKFCVFAGTLLGTIRHKGFIPWDDDLDVCMLRSDYDRFVTTCQSEFKEPYFLQTALSDRRYMCTYARLRNSKTTAVLSWTRSSDYNNGIYIDIHPLDGYIDDDTKLKKQFFTKSAVRMCLNAYYANLKELPLKKRVEYSIIKNTINRLYSYEDLYEKYRKVVSRYNDISNRFAMFDANSIEELSHYLLWNSDLDDIVSMPFEYVSVPVPSRYHEILTHIYGNYMSFPPLDKVLEWHGNMIEFEPDVPYKEYLITNP